jgi:hypothetical protein
MPGKRPAVAAIFGPEAAGVSGGAIAIRRYL